MSTKFFLLLRLGQEPQLSSFAIECPLGFWDIPPVPYLLSVTGLGYILGPSCPSHPILPWYLGIPMEHPTSPWSGLGLELGLGLILVGHPMRSQGTVREWDGMDKRDQGYSRPGTGRMSHGNPGMGSSTDKIA